MTLKNEDSDRKAMIDIVFFLKATENVVDIFGTIVFYFIHFSNMGLSIYHRVFYIFATKYKLSFIVTYFTPVF